MELGEQGQAPISDSTTEFTPEDRTRLQAAFSLENYQIAEDQEGASYVVVTLPEQVEPWVRALRKGLLARVQARLEPMDRLEGIAKAYDQEIRTSDLAEEDETTIRSNPRIGPVLGAVFGELGEGESLTERQRKLIWKMFYQDPFYQNIRAIISWPFNRFIDERQRKLTEQGLESNAVSMTMFNELALKQSPYMQTYEAMFHDQGKDKLPIDRFIVSDSKGEEVIRSPALNSL